MSEKYKFHDPDGIYFVTLTVVDWIDLFTKADYKYMIVESLKYCQKKKGLIVYARCLMSNQIHLIYASKEGFYLSDVLRDFKKFTLSTIIKMIGENKRESRRNWMLWIFRSQGKNSKNATYQFWRQNNQPKELVTNGFVDEKLQYVHNNPVEAGIVSRPEDYLLNSARSYCGEQGLIDVEFLE